MSSWERGTFLWHFANVCGFMVLRDGILQNEWNSLWKWKHTLWRAPGKRVLNNLNPISGQRTILQNQFFSENPDIIIDNIKGENFYTIRRFDTSIYQICQNFFRHLYSAAKAWKISRDYYIMGHLLPMEGHGVSLSVFPAVRFITFLDKLFLFRF